MHCGSDMHESTCSDIRFPPCAGRGRGTLSSATSPSSEWISESLAFDAECARWLATGRNEEHDVYVATKSSFFLFRFMGVVTVARARESVVIYVLRSLPVHFPRSGASNFSSICGAKPVLKHPSVTNVLVK